MILLDVHGLVKHFGPEPVLDGVTFELRPGEKIGLVGPNGAGKSTLLRILCGELEADSGRGALHAGVRMGYLRQHPHFPAGSTVWDEAAAALEELTALAADAEAAATALSEADNDQERKQLEERYERLQYLLTHRDAYNVDHRIERVLDGLRFESSAYRQDVAQLSGGQQNRLLLAKLLLSEPDLMLLDEPSNHLDIDATEWLEAYLRDVRAALLIVSHDRYLLDRVTNRTFELHQGTIDSYPGNFTAYWKQKDERLKVQQRTYDKQKEFIAKTEDFIRRNHYSNPIQAEDRRKKLERLERVPLPRNIAAPVMGFPSVNRSGDVVLRVEHLSKGFARPLFVDLSFDVLRGQRLGMLGPNASGKTTLLRCLVGTLRPDDGQVIVGHGVRIGYYDQMLGGLDPNGPMIDAVRPANRELHQPQRRDLLARFGLTGDMVFQSIASLSGGERSRTALARLAAEEANLLVLDEPTNHLDLWARDALERSLLAFNGTVIFVSHDRYFLNRVADHLLVVEPGRFREIEGNYETYQRLVRAGLAGDARKLVEPDTDAMRGESRKAIARGSKPTTGKRRFPYRKVADLEAEIFQRENRVAELHTALADGDIHRDGPRVRSVRDEVETEQAALAVLYQHWEEAVELNG